MKTNTLLYIQPHLRQMCGTISHRECEILQLVAHEYTTKMIAQKLFISPHTVITHRNNLMAKLDAKNAAGLVRRGFELGLLSINQLIN